MLTSVMMVQGVAQQMLRCVILFCTNHLFAIISLL